MQSKLNQNQIERVRERYREHPLLIASSKAFGHYDACFQRLLFSSEEIFLEAAIVLDRLFTDPNSAKEYVGRLWNELKRKIRYWDKEAPQEDLDKIVGAIFYVVAAVLNLHHHRFFNDEMKELLLSDARKQMKASAEEEEEFIIQLSLCAEGLEEWLKEYIESDELLSEEIQAIDDEDETTTLVPNHFSLPNDDTSIARLKRVLAKLKKDGYVHKNTKAKDWIFVCTGVGEEPNNPIQWLKDYDELGYFVQQFFHDYKKYDRAVHCFLLKSGEVPNATNLRTNATQKAEKRDPLYDIIHMK